MNNCSECLCNGIVKENPTSVLILGMCSTLAVITSVVSGLSMGLSITVALLFSNMIISALHKIIPDRAYIPAYIVIAASLVTIVQLLPQTRVSSLYFVLGIYISLVIANYTILGRVESYASKDSPLVSVSDGTGMDLSFTLALTCIGLVREIPDSGAIFGNVVIPENYHIAVFVLASGAFFAFAVLTALQNRLKTPSTTNGSVPRFKLACGSNCMGCTDSSCTSNHEVLETRERQVEEKALTARKGTVAREEAELEVATSKKEN